MSDEKIEWTPEEIKLQGIIIASLDDFPQEKRLEMLKHINEERYCYNCGRCLIDPRWSETTCEECEIKNE